MWMFTRHTSAGQISDTRHRGITITDYRQSLCNCHHTDTGQHKGCSSKYFTLIKGVSDKVTYPECQGPIPQCHPLHRPLLSHSLHHGTSGDQDQDLHWPGCKLVEDSDDTETFCTAWRLVCLRTWGWQTPGEDCIQPPEISGMIPDPLPHRSRTSSPSPWASPWW